MKKILFAFLLITSLPNNFFAADRIVLLEVFTSSTCGPCATANTYFDNWIRNFSRANKVAIIKYHVWWPAPGNDPFYTSNKTESKNRNNYYGNNYAPHGFINGIKDGSSTASTWGSLISSELGKAALLKIDVQWKQISNDSGNATIIIEADTTTLPTGTYNLQVAVIENNIAYTGTNGDPIHHQVMRKMLPSDAGEDFLILKGEKKEFTRPLKLSSSWKVENVQIVAFVQIKETKEILNAGRYLDQLLSLNDEKTAPKFYNLYQNFPNPFNPTTTIEFTLPSKQRAKIKIFDLLGNEILTIIDKDFNAGINSVKFNAEKFTSGIYFYSIETKEFKQTKKMLLLK